MGRKRKSELISKDDYVDFVDLSMAYGVDEDAPTIPKPPIPVNNASSVPVLDYKEVRSNFDRLHSRFHFANAMSQATRTLDESARSMQMHSQQLPIHFDQGCTPCKYAEMKCDLQRPVCDKCRSFRAKGNVLTCSYTPNLYQQVERSRAETSTLPRRSEHTEVEIIDLGSDDEKDADGSGEEFEVEAIIARRSSRKTGLEYMVKWKGYPHEANTWEPMSNLDGAQSFINDYEVTIASTLPSKHKKGQKRPKTNSIEDLKRSLSLGLVIVPRNPKVLEHQTSRPIPELVESIDACRLVPNDDTYEYLVNWKGLAPNQSSWEAEERFTGCKMLIHDYHLATCIDFVSNDAITTTEHNGTDPVQISAGTQVIVCSRRTGLSSRLTYCVYDKDKDTHLWIPGSDLVSNEAQTAILLFVMRSKIMQEDLAPHKTSALKNALSRYQIPGPVRGKKINLNTTANSHESRAQDTRLTGMMPLPSANITSETAWKTGFNNFRLQGRQTLRKASASDAVSHTPASRSPLVVKGNSHLIVNRAASDKIGNDLRQIREPTGIRRLPDSLEIHNLTHADENWMTEHISRTTANLSEEEKTRIRKNIAKDWHMQTSAEEKVDPLFWFLRSIAGKELQTWKARNRGMVSQMSDEKTVDPSCAKKENGQGSRNSQRPSIQLPGILEQSSIPEQIASPSDGRKGHYYEELKDAFNTPKRSYPEEDSYLVVRKTDGLSRPLPRGRRNHHNVASNVLLAIGKHPWLPGLNHHLRGLLDRGPGGRKLNSVPAQVRNAENFKEHKAPSSMSEMMEANFRATLSMGGKSL